MRRVFAALLLAAVLPAVAQSLYLGTPASLSAARVGVTGARAHVSAIASNGDSFLVLWWDDRAQTTFQSIYDIGWAMRIGADGQPLDEIPLALPFVPGGAVWVGNEWVVSGSGVVARISAAGMLIETKPTRAGFGGEGIVWTGNAFVLPSGRVNRVAALTLDANLNVVKDETLLDDPRGQVLGAASDGQSALITYIGDNAIAAQPVHAAVFGRDGLLEQRSVLTPYSDFRVRGGSLGATDRGYVFLSSFEGETHAIWIERDLRTRPIGTVGPDSLVAGSSVRSGVWDGTYLTFYRALTTASPHVNGLYATRYTSAGFLHSNVRMTEWTPIAPYLAAAAANGRTLLSYRELSMSIEDRNDRVHVRVFSQPEEWGTAPDRTPLEVGAFSQEVPAGASSTTQSLVAWREASSPTASTLVYATRLDANGKPLDPQSLLLGDTCPAFGPAVASNGVDFVVAWYSESSIRTAHVRADGTSTTTRGPTIHSRCGDSQPALGSNGNGYLMAWTAPTDPQRTKWRLYGLRLTSAGVPIDDLPFTITDIAAQAAARVVSNGTDYLVVWHSRAARVASDGVSLDRDRHITLGSGGVEAVWWNGRTYVVITREGLTVRTLRIAPDGSGGVSPFGPQPAPTPVPSTYQWTRAGFGTADANGYSLPVLQTDSATGVRRLAVVRYDDDGTTVTVRVQPVANRRFGPELDPLSPAVGLVNAGRPVMITLEQRLEPPYAGVHHLFAAPFVPPRMRAVRH